MRYLSFLLLVLLAACNMTSQSSSETPEESIASPAAGFVAYWVGTDVTALNDDAILIGCETYLSPIESSIALSSPEDNIRNSLQLTFTSPIQVGQRNVWAEDLQMTVDSVLIENSLASINLSGQIMMRGTCADAEMEAQILMAVFAESSVESALIMLGDTNMRQYFDMSGQTGSDFTYTRANIPYAD